MAGESASASARRLREASERLARSAERWERGAEGERATAVALADLPAESWTVFHDLRWPGRRYANIDHVVVGPPGIFVIDSKHWSGSITVEAGLLRQDGRSRESAVAGAAEAASAIAFLLGHPLPGLVYPVLCFAGVASVTGRAGDVLLCSTADVTALMRSRPTQLGDDQRRKLSRELEASFAAAARVTETRKMRTATSRTRSPRLSSVRSQRRVRRPRPAVRAAAFVVGLGVLGAALASPMPTWIGGQLVSIVADGSTDSPDRQKQDDRQRRGDESRRHRERAIP